MVEANWCRNDDVVGRSKLVLARSYWQRTRGLLGRPSPQEGEGLSITPCNSIHMFFMRYAIDVVFLDGRGVVLRLCPQVRPWRLRSCWRAAEVVELAAGEIERLGLNIGDRLQCTN